MTDATSSGLLALALQARGSLSTPSATRPFVLDDPQRIRFVLQGSVDVFMVQTTPLGEPTGVREYLHTADAGGLLFGLDADDGLVPMGLLAVASVGTQLVEAGASDVQNLLADAAPQAAFGAALDAWVQALSLAMVAPIQPRPALAQLAVPGTSLDAGAQQRIGTKSGTAWVDCAGAQPVYLDTEEPVLDAGACLPLAAHAWLTLPQAARLQVLATADIVGAGRWQASLRALHSAFLGIVPLNLRLAAVDEHNRLRSRNQADLAAGQQALDDLARPLSGKRRRSGDAIDHDDPLVHACAAIFEHMGHPFQPPARRHGDEAGAGKVLLRDVARQNRVRTRQVVLDAGWWRNDVGPFLLQPDTEGAAPVAILPRGLRGGYAAADPATGLPRQLSAAELDGLRGQAWTFLPPLPARKLTLMDVSGNALRWSPADVVTVVGLTLAGGLLSMGVPIATGFLVDEVIPSWNMPKLVEIAVLLILAALVGAVFSFGVQIASVRIEGRVGTRLQAAILDRVLTLPMTFFRDYTAGDLARRALTIQAIEQALSGAVVSTAMSAVFAVFSLGLMFKYSTTLALWALGLILLLTLVMAILSYLRMGIERDTLKRQGETSGLLLQLAGAVAKLRLAGAEERAFLRWARLYGRLSHHRYDTQRLNIASSITSAVYNTLSSAAIFTVIVYTEAGKGGLALGTLLAFLSAFGRASGNLTSFTQVLLSLVALKPTIEYTRPILDAMPEADAAKADPGRLAGAISLDHVNFGYGNGSAPIFSDLTLSIAAGEYVAIVGPSGSGKSTLMRLLLGFEQPQSGAIMFDNLDLASIDVQAVRRQLGVVLQNGKLMPGSLKDNILGANLHLTEQDAWEAARQAGLEEDIRQMPMGMHTVVTDSGGALSGGQVQRLLIARALVARPAVLLLDEATSALDNRTQSIVTASLEKLAATRIVIAHRLSTIVEADRIVVLRDGAVEETGSYDELMARQGFFHTLAARQLV